MTAGCAYLTVTANMDMYVTKTVVKVTKSEVYVTKTDMSIHNRSM